MRTEQFNDDETSIRDLVSDWAAAVRRKDLAGILRYHSPDILMFDVPPPLQCKGIEAYQRTWDLFFSMAREPVMFDITEMTVVAGGDVAFAAAVMRCAERDSSGQDTVLEFRLTVGLRKVEGQWMVVHEHHSVPAES